MSEIIEKVEYLDDSGTWKEINVLDIKAGMFFRIPELNTNICKAAGDTYLNENGIPTIEVWG